jgi:cysteinyl-tRNA synthetase
MPIFIYNSLTRKKEEFIPLHPPQVNIYTCGVTVYDESHIGHARSLYIFDVVRRYLKYRGLNVKFVRNITDIDDKIINRAKELKIDWKDLVKKYIDRYYEDLETLGIQRGDYEPRATENISDMIKHIEGLINKGFAYVTDSGVYFNVRKFKDYGKLSGQGIDQMQSGCRIEPDETKQDPLDFALWKISKPDEPSWPSPWGQGRPGWHIECSVMSQKFLNTDTLDIHAGGRDLIFPHHENEIAQAESLTGKPFAKYWIHHGLLTINGQKMAKSLGNFITAKDILNRHSPDALKIFFLSTHYAHPIDFTEEKIQEADRARGRFINLNDRLNSVKFEKECRNPKVDAEIDSLKKEFEDAMDDDFNTAQAIAALFKIVSITDGYFTQYKKNIEKIMYAKSVLLNLANVLGLSLVSHEFKIELAENIRVTDSVKMEIIKADNKDAEIKEKIRLREEARKKMDFQKADEIRKELENKGIILEDTKDGTIWRRKL